MIRAMVNDVRVEMGDVGGELDDIRVRRILLKDLKDVDVLVCRLICLVNLLKIELVNGGDKSDREMLGVMERARVEFMREGEGEG